MKLKLSLKTTLCGIVSLILVSCGEGERSAETQAVTFKIERDTSKDTGFQLTGDEPLFIGLNILGDELSFKPIQIVAGEEYILDLPRGVDLEVRAKVITVGQTSGQLTRYFSTQVAQAEKLAQGDSEILLQFPAFQEVKSVNVYGVATDGGKTVAGWGVKPVDSFTQVTFSLPGEQPVSTTDAEGAFSFRMFVGADTSAESVKMQFTSPKKEVYFKDFSLPSSLGPGFSVGYVNLGGSEPVMLGQDQYDFDGDGILNLDEALLGTNPFKVNLNGCVDPSQVVKGFEYTCPDGTFLTGTLEQQAGLNCYDAVGDRNADGVIDGNDCSGYGAGISVAAEPAGTQCVNGGQKISTWTDVSPNQIYDVGVDTNLAHAYVCHGQDGLNGQDGANGQDGVNGQDGKDAPVTAPSLYVSMASKTPMGPMFGTNFVVMGDGFFNVSQQQLGEYALAGETYYFTEDCTGSVYSSQGGRQLVFGSDGSIVIHDPSSAPLQSQKPLSIFDGVRCHKISAYAESVGLVGSRILYSHGSHGIFYSDDGITWSLADTTSGLGSTYIDKIYHDGTYVYALHSGNYFSRSADGGATWTFLNNTGTPYSISDIEKSSNGYLYVTSGDGLYKSADSGTTFTLLASGSFRRVATNGNALLVARDTSLSEGYGIMYSTDAGATWYEFGTEKSFSNHGSVQEVFMDGTDLYVGFGYEGLFKSTDGGVTWIQLNNVPGAHVIEKSNSTMYVGTNKGLYITKDAGSTFTVRRGREAGLSTYPTQHSDVDRLAVSAGGFVVTRGSHGVAVSTDSGLNFVTQGPSNYNTNTYTLFETKPSTATLPTGINIDSLVVK